MTVNKVHIYKASHRQQWWVSVHAASDFTNHRYRAGKSVLYCLCPLSSVIDFLRNRVGRGQDKTERK